MPFIKRADLNAILLAGRKMSNLCYNLAQSEVTKPVGMRNQISMRETQVEWDKTTRGLYKPTRKKVAHA